MRTRPHYRTCEGLAYASHLWHSHGMPTDQANSHSSDTQASCYARCPQLAWRRPCGTTSCAVVLNESSDCTERSVTLVKKAHGNGLVARCRIHIEGVSFDRIAKLLFPLFCSMVSPSHVHEYSLHLPDLNPAALCPALTRPLTTILPIVSDIRLIRQTKTPGSKVTDYDSFRETGAKKVNPPIPILAKSEEAEPGLTPSSTSFVNKPYRCTLREIKRSKRNKLVHLLASQCECSNTSSCNLAITANAPPTRARLSPVFTVAVFCFACRVVAVVVDGVDNHVLIGRRVIVVNSVVAIVAGVSTISLVAAITSTGRNRRRLSNLPASMQGDLGLRAIYGSIEVVSIGAILVSEPSSEGIAFLGWISRFFTTLLPTVTS